MAAKKAPAKKAPAKKAVASAKPVAKKTPSSAADFRKADQKSIKQYRRTYGSDPKKTRKPIGATYSDAEATAELKQAFMLNARLSSKQWRNRNVAPKTKITLANWAAQVDDVMGDTWFEGQEASDIGYERANKILRQNREKWLKPLFEGTKKVEDRTTLGSYKNTKKK